jgi:membrane associated rhomboid family serine protease
MPSPAVLVLLVAIATILGAFLFVAGAVPLIPLRRRGHGASAVPVFTLLIVCANLVVFAASQQNGELNPAVARLWGLTPSAPTLLTLVSYMFLHGYWWHLLGNMLAIWLFGAHVEEALGRWEYLLFYLGSGIAAGLFHVGVTATLMPAAAAAPLVGASGALSGILGLFVVRFWRAKIRVLLLFEVPAILAVAAFVLYQLVNGVLAVEDGGRTSNTAFWAHIGGLLFGALIAIPLRMHHDSRHEYNLEDGAKAAAAGDNSAAAAHYRQALTLNPDDPAAHHSLARAYVNLRQGEAAHRHLMDAMRLYLRGGHSLAVARVYEEALANFETFPLPPNLLQRVASACEESEQYGLAVHALSEICRDHPQAREAEMSLLRLGKLHLQKMDQPQNAEGIFSEFVRLYPTSDWTPHALRLQDEARRAAASTCGRFPLSGA